MQVVAHKRAEWAEVWQVASPKQEQMPRPWLSHSWVGLPPMELQHFEASFGHYKRNAGIGADGFHPRCPQDLAQGPKQRILDYLQ
eukprot:7599397-Lingulodinium_polyedra.AAC.1